MSDIFTQRNASPFQTTHLQVISGFPSSKMNDIEEIDPRVQRRAARAMKRATQFYLRMAIRFASVRPCWYIRPSPVKPDVATAIDDGYEADTDGPGSNGLTKSGIKGPKDKASQSKR